MTSLSFNLNKRISRKGKVATRLVQKYEKTFVRIKGRKGNWSRLSLRNCEEQFRAATEVLTTKSYQEGRSRWPSKKKTSAEAATVFQA